MLVCLRKRVGCVWEGGAVSVTFGKIEVRDWTERREKKGGVKPQNGVKVHDVTAAPPTHPQTPISLCKDTHSDPHLDCHRHTQTQLFYMVLIADLREMVTVNKG